MPFSWKPIALSSAGVLLLAGGVALSTPSPAAAQCGSQSSSCENCHEVQAQMPVNGNGDWHVSHAFGDFCEFCHAGNVQATDAETAHQGMVEPLADPASSCGACHPREVADLAIVYGTALGIQVGSVADGPPAAAPTAAPTPTEPTLAAAVAATPSSADMVDYNAQYAETVEGKQPGQTGYVILGALVALIVIGGGCYMVWNERRRRRSAASPAVTPTPPSGTPAPAAATGGNSPHLIPILSPLS